MMTMGKRGQKPLTMERDAEIVRLYSKEMMRKIDIARKMKLDQSIVSRVLSSVPSNKRLTITRARNMGLLFGSSKHVSDDAMQYVFARIKGDETITACLSRLAVELSKHETRKETQ
jgi:hypothetical protein